MTAATYTIGSEEITYAATAPAEIAGTTATIWYVRHDDGRKVASGFLSAEEAIRARRERIANETPVTVALANGDTVKVVQGGVDRFRGIDQHGNKVFALDVDSDYTYPVTPCCDATGKGTARGIVCRACWDEVDSYFGGPVAVVVPVAGR
jgi:hypothetical protein